jgi:glucose-1-phosphate cytidylyltransferase
MKVVILAGGLGTRLSEETSVKPKPMVEIGGMPILWHIMKIYSSYGYNDFVICLGYKGYLIKEFFNNYFLHKSDITVDLKNNKVIFNESDAESWTITLVDTGANSMTGGRIKRIQKHIGNEPFFLTYGDGLSDVNILELLKTHKQSKKYLTVTSVQPNGRFGALNLSPSNEVLSFLEKPKGDGSWINGGFFVCQPEIFNYIFNDETIFEKDTMESLAKEGQMQAYLHNGFWKPMDTLRDKIELEELWSLGDKTPWNKWK